MSMITEYARLRPAELSEFRRLLIEAPDDAYEFASDLTDQDVEEEDPTPRGMDTDKAWAGLEYLLAKFEPPVNVISGGTAVTDGEWGYDSPRLLTVDEVMTTARFLDETPFGRLAERFDPAELAAADVYPSVWDEEWALEYLADAYVGLVAFFHAAAVEGDSILIWMS
jgi:Domain of unknown function (DUF1877)